MENIRKTPKNNQFIDLWLNTAKLNDTVIFPAEAAAARHAVPAAHLLLPLQLRGPHYALPGRGRRERETGEQTLFSNL